VDGVDVAPTAPLSLSLSFSLPTYEKIAKYIDDFFWIGLCFILLATAQGLFGFN